MGKKHAALSQVGLSFIRMVQQLRKDMDGLLATGGRPHDYSLGFTNGIIMAEHKINMRPGRPRFYNQEMQIGSLPKPTHYDTEAEKETRIFMSRIVDQARVLSEGFRGDVTIGVSQEALELSKILEEFDEHLEKVELAEEASTMPGASPEPLTPQPDDAAEIGAPV